MLTPQQRDELERKILVQRAEIDAGNVTITLTEEAEFNKRLAEFLSRTDPASRCTTLPGVVCNEPLLVPVCARVEKSGRLLSLSKIELLVMRYWCLSCGAVVVAAIERSATTTQNSESTGVAG